MAEYRERGKVQFSYDCNDQNGASRFDLIPDGENPKICELVLASMNICEKAIHAIEEYRNTELFELITLISTTITTATIQSEIHERARNDLDGGDEAKITVGIKKLSKKVAELLSNSILNINANEFYPEGTS